MHAKVHVWKYTQGVQKVREGVGVGRLGMHASPVSTLLTLNSQRLIHQSITFSNHFLQAENGPHGGFQKRMIDGLAATTQHMAALPMTEPGNFR